MNQAKMTEYASIREKIAELQAKERMLKDSLTQEAQAHFDKTGEKTLKTPVGKFTVSEYKQWEYSESLKKFEAKANDEIKEIKAKVSEKKEWARTHGKAKELAPRYQLSFSPSV